MQFALSTHLFHGDRLTRSHIELAHEHGFAAVELFATRTHFDYRDDRHIADVGDWLAALGMRACSVHAPICASFVGGEWGRAFSNASANAVSRQEAVDETAKAMAAARTLDCDTAVLHLGLPRGQPIPPDDNNWGAVRRSLEQLAEVASRTGVRLALELIPNDLSRPDALLEWLDGEMDLGETAVCLDFGHAHLVGGAPEAAEQLAGHVVTTHVHDNRGASDDHLVPFAGTIDWASTLTSMWKTGYTGPLVFEVADHGDAVGVLRRTVSARARLQAILDELAVPFEFGDGRGSADR
jgi:sugar phosphate isomerase/epimerase